jgi:hypothetical protein
MVYEIFSRSDHDDPTLEQLLSDMFPTAPGTAFGKGSALMNRQRC